ncbi:uncharacterized protein LOC115478487 [Microcaecilia unicolor]|uniref:Uncharacterized protein LOC115478487 n=1 Tax=Microcaecilia unicolor TaxID=1415580 RepID=A0A6P7Z2Z0_9AMPH|nr:uncharacterized protein LOC115478487 [Microcaecilia unicolor]
MGRDEHSENFMQYCAHVDMEGVAQLREHRTATYCAVMTDNGELSLGLGDMDIHQQITEDYVSEFKGSLCKAPMLCIDGNVPVSTIQYVCQISRDHHIPVFYEPTDEKKACKPFLSDIWTTLTYISPNLLELKAINETLGNSVPKELPMMLDDIISLSMTLSQPLLEHLHCVIVTLGIHGLLLCGRNEGGNVSLQPGTHKKSPGELCAVHYPAAPISTAEIVNVSGAGDSLVAGIIAGMLTGLNTNTCIRMGLLCARLSLCSQSPISEKINFNSVSLKQVQSQKWPDPKLWKIE